jgi:hypothetical protein
MMEQGRERDSDGLTSRLLVERCARQDECVWRGIGHKILHPHAHTHT